MVRIAVLGGSSQIAKDYIRLNAAMPEFSFTAFVRPESHLATSKLFGDGVQVRTYDDAEVEDCFDIVINCVGVGDPARAKSSQQTIVETSKKFDDLAIRMASKNPLCKYIFLSSGVAYGIDFETPASALTVPRNSFDASNVADHYALAKFQIEQYHRQLSEMQIYDLRVFGYFNHTMSVNFEFLLSKIARAILQGRTFETSSDSIMRDYSNANDFSLMINALISGPDQNVALDLYSQAPVEKFTLLETLSENFGLNYTIVHQGEFHSPTGAKPKYYSENHSAEAFGFRPPQTALETVKLEFSHLLSVAQVLTQEI